MEMKDQLDSLTVSYQRMANSLQRIAKSVEQHGRAIMGEISEDNKLVPGLLQRTADLETVIKNFKYTRRQWWAVIRDIGVGVAVACVLFHFGIRG